MVASALSPAVYIGIYICILIIEINVKIKIIHAKFTYRQNSNIRRTLIGNIIFDNSDVVGASPFGSAPTTSSLST